jgi:chromosome segregation ATPase
MPKRPAKKIPLEEPSPHVDTARGGQGTKKQQTELERARGKLEEEDAELKKAKAKLERTEIAYDNAPVHEKAKAELAVTKAELEKIEAELAVLQAQRDVAEMGGNEPEVSRLERMIASVTEDTLALQSQATRLRNAEGAFTSQPR